MRPPPPSRCPDHQGTTRRAPGPTPTLRVQRSSALTRGGMPGSADGVPGSAGVLSALAGGQKWTIRRRPTIVEAGGTPALPGGSHAGSSAEVTAAQGVPSSCLAPWIAPASGLRTPRDRNDAWKNGVCVSRCPNHAASHRIRTQPMQSDDRRPHGRPQSPYWSSAANSRSSIRPHSGPRGSNRAVDVEAEELDGVDPADARSELGAVGTEKEQGRGHVGREP